MPRATIDPGSRNNFQQLLANGKKLAEACRPRRNCIRDRSDDVAAVAYFYLDRPTGVLPPIAGPREMAAIGEQTHWVSPENSTGAKGAGARENKGAKGHDRPGLAQ